jgi:hypothetical protein
MIMTGLRRSVLPAFVAALLSSAARADFTIDNFSTATPTLTQSTVGTSSSGAITVGAGDSRTISLTVASPLTSASASVGSPSGFASASFDGNFNPANANSNFDLKETFVPLNATTLGVNFLSFTLGSTLGTTLTITANGTSTYTFTDPASTTGIPHSIAFTSFSNPAAFNSLTSLEFTATFPNTGISGPSVTFTSPILLTNAIINVTTPEPASLLMLGMGASGIFLGAYSQKRGKARLAEKHGN